MTREEFFNSLNTGTKWDVGVAINRNNPLPLDASSVYESLEALTNYATTSKTVYVGQICTVVGTDEVAAYQITSIGEGATVVKLAASSASGDVAGDITLLQTKVGQLETKVSTLEGLIGDSENGISKDVSDNAAAIATVEDKIGTVTEGKTLVEMIGEAVYDDTALAGRVSTIESDYLKTADKTELTEAIATAKQEAIATVLGEGTSADFDTLKEIADWILSDTTGAAALITRVTTIENDYLKGTDKTELQGEIDALETFVGTLPEGATSTTVVAYIQEVVDGLKIGDYAKASELTALADRVTAIETKLATVAEGAQVNIIDSVDTAQFAIDGNKNLTLLDIAMGKVTGLTDALAGKADKGTTLAEYGITDAYTKTETLEKIAEKITEINGGESAGEVLGQLNSYKEINDDRVDTIEAKVNTIAEGAQVNVLESVKVGGTVLEIAEKAVNIPVATDTVLGVVMSSTAENKISVGTDGTMEVNSVNVNKLVQTEGETLVLNGGSATV